MTAPKSVGKAFSAPEEGSLRKKLVKLRKGGILVKKKPWLPRE